MKFESISKIRSCIAAFAFVVVCFVPGWGQGVGRVIVIKIDGLPGYYVDQFVNTKDPETGRSMLPWIDQIFYKNGTRLENFYTRGISISGPSWGVLDTGQPAHIKGNVEFDRYTLYPYDYLNFIPYYVAYGFGHVADMPAAEVMDQLGIPLLADAFPYERRYTSHQLYQRGNNWEVLASGFVNLYPGSPGEMIDEWTMGIDFRKTTVDQVERDIIRKVVKLDELDYFDYYDASFDHVSHHNHDTGSRLYELRLLDRLIGRIWNASMSSNRAAETALILVSDHGINTEEKVISQSFNIVKALTSSAGGGHHAGTKRRLLQDYAIKGIYPFTPLIKTSGDSNYLKGKAAEYPTVLVDFDGNERSSLHFRDSDVNVLHILLQQLQWRGLSAGVRTAATKAFFDVIDRRRSEWQLTADQLTEELAAVKRSVSEREPIVDKLPAKFSSEDIDLGIDKAARRFRTLVKRDRVAVEQHEKHLETFKNRLKLRPENFDPRKIKIDDLIAKNSMGDQNTVHKMQNYVTGLSREGLTLAADGTLDIERSFSRIDYFDFFLKQRVRNNVQPRVSSQPVDFVAMRIPTEVISRAITDEVEPNDDAVWIYGGRDRQILILTNTGMDGVRRFRYLPVGSLKQSANGEITFERKPFVPGLPLKYFEDAKFAIPEADRKDWLESWHTEAEWLRATHLTLYSNGLISLFEQIDRQPINREENGMQGPDERLIDRFRNRQRLLTDADLHVLSSNHWDFDVKGFNPGGNHGSFFRASSNSTLMFAGGEKTGIPRGLKVVEPYDTLSLVPTVFRLMGEVDENNVPSRKLYDKGFRRFPGPVIKELFGNGARGSSK